MSINERSQNPTDDGLAANWLPKVNVRSALLTAIFLLLLLHAIHIAADILIPITLALLLSLLLSPIVNRLESKRVPTSIGAGFAVMLIVLPIGTGLYFLAEPASLWMEEAPSLFKQMERRIGEIREPIEQLEIVADNLTELSSGTSDAEVVEVRLETLSLTDWLLNAAPATLASVATTVLLMYFMLASGDRFLRRMVEQIPRFEDKKAAVETVRAIQGNLSQYLYTISLINIALGVVTALTLQFLSVPNPILWGVIAGLLNFAPYVGPIVMIVLLALVGLVSFDTMDAALLPAGMFFLITAIEGQLITPMLAGRRLELNPVAIVLTIVVLGWLWGTVGVLIAVPVLVCAKIICARIEPLATIAVFLERYPT